MYIIPQLYKSSKILCFLFLVMLLFFFLNGFEYFYFQQTGHFYGMKESTSVTRLVKDPYFWWFYSLDCLVLFLIFILKFQHFKIFSSWFIGLTIPVLLYYFWNIGGIPWSWFMIILGSFYSTESSASST